MLSLISVVFHLQILFCVGFEWPECASGLYFEPGLLECQACPANSSMVTSPDGFGCSCADHHVPAGPDRCRPCNATELVSSDGFSCVRRKCQSSAGRIVCKKCPADYITVTQNLDGSPAKEVQCIKCARGYKAENNKCVKCEACICARNQIIVRDICVPKVYATMRPKYEENRLHPQALLDVVKHEYLCTKNDKRACRKLASECVRDFYSTDPAGPCRLWTLPNSNSIVPKGLPVLAVDPKSTDHTPGELILPRGQKNLTLMSAIYTSRGGFKLLRDPNKKDFLCQFPIEIVIGSDFSHDCIMDASTLNAFDYDETRAVFLRMDGWRQSPITVRTPTGSIVQRGKWPTNNFKRYFVLDKVMSTITNNTNIVYLRNLFIRLRIERDKATSGSLAVHISIEAEYAIKPALAKSVTTTLRVIHEMPSAGVLKGLEIWCGVLGALLVVYALLQWRGVLRRGGHYVTIGPLLSAAVADTLYFAAWFSTLHALAAEAGSLGLTLPLSQSEDNTVKYFIYLAFSLKAFRVVWLNWHQCRCDVFFLDWSEYHSSQSDGFNPHNWRMAALGREWSNIQTKRRVSTRLTVIFTLMILHIMSSWQTYLPQGDGYKWAVASVAWWSSYTALLLVRGLLDKFVGSPVSRLSSVCTGVGLSLLVFQEEHYAHYVHGRDDDAKELRSMVGPLATCRVVCAPQLRAVYKQLSIPGSVAMLGGSETKQILLSKFLAAFFERALDGLSWVASERSVLERLLDVELSVREAGNTSTLLYDPDDNTPSCVAVTWWGHEWSLATFDNMLFSCVLVATDSLLLAGLITTIVWQLEKFEFRLTSKLAKKVKRFSKMDGDEIQSELETYKSELQEKLPKRTEFFQAINEVFTLRENLLFNDYIRDLFDYANNNKLTIKDETERIIKDVIVGSIFKFLSTRDRIELDEKLRRAIKEYKGS